VATAPAPAAAKRTVEQPARVVLLVLIGLEAGLVAGLLDVVIYWVGRFLGVPFEVHRPGGGLILVNWSLVLITCVLAGVMGALLAAVVRALPQAPTWVAAGGALLTVASLAYPLLLQSADVEPSTRIWLAVLHVVAGVIIVWSLSRGVTSDDPPPGALEALER
jgi:hypothetical protein